MKVIKFGAQWCSGCLVMRPRWEKIEQKHPEISSRYADYDANPDMVRKYRIDGETLPVFILVDDTGKELERRSGEISEQEIELLLTKYRNI